MALQRQNHVGLAFPFAVQELSCLGELSFELFQLRRRQLYLPACVRDFHWVAPVLVIARMASRKRVQERKRLRADRRTLRSALSRFCLAGLIPDSSLVRG